MSTATLSAKRCVNCHKDVTNGKRMKDSSGRYWCVACGTADQKKRAGASGTTGELCVGCGDRFPAGKLSKYGAAKLCSGCIKERTKGPGLLAGLKGGGGGSTDKGRLIKMLLILGLMVAGAVWRFSTL